MKNDVEKELKMALSKENYDILLHSYEYDEVIRQQNIYMDTPEESIKGQKGALRIRITPAENIITIKLPRDSISKFEYEKKTEASGLETFSQEDWDFIHEHLPEIQNLKVIADFVTIRHYKYLDGGEICLDETVFGSVTDYELEYEYHKEHDGITILDEFLKPAGIQYTKQGPSKLARAMSYKENL